jgi:hypothetical protein
VGRRARREHLAPHLEAGAEPKAGHAEPDHLFAEAAVDLVQKVADAAVSAVALDKCTCWLDVRPAGLAARNMCLGGGRDGAPSIFAVED